MSGVVSFPLIDFFTFRWSLPAYLILARMGRLISPPDPCSLEEFSPMRLLTPNLEIGNTEKFGRFPREELIFLAISQEVGFLP